MKKYLAFLLALVTVCALVACAHNTDGSEILSTESNLAVTQPAQETTPEEKAEETPSVALYDVPLDADLQLHIIEQAEAHGIDPAIVFAMAWQESRYNPDAIGDGGNSLGLMQIQPRWHSGRMERLDCPDLFDPFQNVTVGVDYLAENLRRYDGDIAKALTAYNRGHYAGEVTGYARSVLAKAAELAVICE